MSRLTTCLLAVWLCLGFGSTGFAEIVYDMLYPDIVWDGNFWSETSKQMAAQPFQIGDHNTINSVTMTLYRLGNPSGFVHFDVFDDDGAGSPRASIGRLGSIDANLVQQHLGNETYTFDSPVTGLTPNEQYYIVYSIDEETKWPFEGSALQWGATRSSAGAFGAGEALWIAPEYGVNAWKTIRGNPAGPPYPVWLYAQVDAEFVSSTPCDLNVDTFCDFADIDLLTGEIAAGEPFDAETFDLNGDGNVDDGDVTKWLSDAATRNGFAAAYLDGDSNLDGSVNAADLNNLALNWQQNVSTWSDGDFTADGTVNAADLNALALNWQQSIATAPVPEPSAATLLVLGAVAFVRWRGKYIRRRGYEVGCYSLVIASSKFKIARHTTVSAA